MSPPTVRVNTFVKDNEKSLADPISKTFIIMESFLGLNRMPLMGKGKAYVFATFILFLIINGTILYIHLFVLSAVVVLSVTAQNISCSLLSFVRCKWMLKFYGELGKFDGEAGCTPKVSFAGIRNIVLGVLSCIFVILLFLTPYLIFDFNFNPLYVIPFYLVYILEVYFFGHLLNLLTLRLKLINYYLESSLSSAITERNPTLKEFVYFKSYDPKRAQTCMRTLMDLYQIVVEAYDCLIEGIKWQMLSIIITAFVLVLGLLYQFSLNTIHDGGVMRPDAIYQIGLPIILLTPLFSPCMFGDCVHSEVTKLRELLASRLYENKLDKCGRSAARALLAFTETRDLSFRLLRMLDIDISLPFKFVGLLVTYLIILLQFEKVINP